MAEQTNSSVPDARPVESEDAKSGWQADELPRGRSEYVIAFGVVALVSMLVGFLIGLMF